MGARLGWSEPDTTRQPENKSRLGAKGSLMPTSAQFASCPGSFDILPLHRIRTSYADLRPGRPTVETEPLSPLPIRVVPVDDNEGAYEVIDGFKRLEA